MSNTKTARKPLPVNLTIEEMLERKTLEQLLEDKDIFEPKDAAPLMGYVPMYVHQLCRRGRIEHVKRGGRYYLYARTVHGVATHVAPTTRKSK